MAYEWLASTRRPLRCTLTGSVLAAEIEDAIAAIPFVLGSQESVGLVVLPAAAGEHLVNPSPEITCKLFGWQTKRAVDRTCQVIFSEVPATLLAESTSALSQHLARCQLN